MRSVLLAYVLNSVVGQLDTYLGYYQENTEPTSPGVIFNFQKIQTVFGLFGSSKNLFDWNSSYPPANEVWGKVIFSQVSVIL